METLQFLQRGACLACEAPVTRSPGVATGDGVAGRICSAALAVIGLDPPELDLARDTAPSSVLG